MFKRSLRSLRLLNWPDVLSKRKDEIDIFAWLLIAVSLSALQHDCSQLSNTEGIQRNFHFSEVVLASFSSTNVDSVLTHTAWSYEV